jgi:Cys-tRNA(Pro)/Cys-tRNA(Cys) deacylase
MKKFFRTVVHATAESFPTIYFSGGKIGLQIELPPETLARVIHFEYADIIR